MPLERTPLERTLLESNLAIIQYPSLVQGLADRMVGAIAAHPESAAHPEFAHLNLQIPQVSAVLDPRAMGSLGWMPLPLFTPSDQHFGTFTSPLLLQLSKGAEASTVQRLGAELLQSFVVQTKNDELSPQLWVHPKGWLYADFDAGHFAHGLDGLMMAGPMLISGALRRERLDGRSPIRSDPVIFGVQHAHARCCSVLCLAQQEKLLPLQDVEHFLMEGGLSLWQRDSGELRLQTKAEKALLLALMQFPQSLSPQKEVYGCCHPRVAGAETLLRWPLSQGHLYKQATVWGQLWADFDRDCRLFGAVSKNMPQLALARFALVYMVRKVLAFLLEEILQVAAPLAL